jgi:hypothetical protein
MMVLGYGDFQFFEGTRFKFWFQLFKKKTKMTKSGRKRANFKMTTYTVFHVYECNQNGGGWGGGGNGDGFRV